MNSILKWVIPSLLLGGIVGYFISGQTKNAAVPVDAHSTISTAATTSEENVYICSMHPQIRQAEPGICPICEMDLVTANSQTSSDPTILEMTKEAVQLANIQTTIVGEGEAARSTIRLSGKVQADERQISSQVSHVSGRIEKLHVSFTGERVRNGQLLATIYAPEFITAQRELLEAEKLQDINPNLVVAARQKLAYWKVDEATIEQIETTGTIQETLPIYAQQAGVVMERKVAVGDYVQRGEVLLTVMNLEQLWVVFEAYEEELSAFQKGSPIEFTTPALPNRTFRSRVTFIDPIINPDTRTAAIRTEINNANGLLKPEMLVYGQLQSSATPTTQLLVPKTAVLWTGKRSVAYVKIPNTIVPTFQFRQVELGEAVGNQYEIIAGLEAGEEVVTYGNFTIDAAAQLNNQASMMNQDIGIKGLPISDSPDFRQAVSEDFQQQLTVLAQHYISLKDALVDSDSMLGRSATEALLEQINNIDAQSLSGDALAYWEEQSRHLTTHAQQLLAATALTEQRQQFEFVSTALIHLLQAFGTTETPFYVQHCPMAFDDRGADWLAMEEAIRNPYFGDRMLKCGRVTEVLAENTH